MKRKLFTAIAVILLAAGLAMLIVPRISNRVGEQIAHTTVEDFKALKSKSTYDEPTEKKESSEESTQRENSEAECLRILQVEEKGLNPESRNSSDNVPKIDFDRLYSDSISLPEEVANDYLLKHNDVLFARSGATVGKAFIYKIEYGKSAFAGYLIKASLNEKLLPDLLFYFTQSSIYEEWKKQIFVQATIQNIGADRYKDLPVILPHTDEQSEIVAYLDEKTAAIDSLIQKKEQLITELEAYKKSLIYEYVTGKKEVPDNKIISISVEFQIALLMCKILKNTDIKGRIHLQKVTYASDTLLDLFPETQYYRYPHGPYDLNIERYESIMESQGWVTVDKSKGYVRYTKTKRFIEFESQYQDVFKNRDNEIQKICTLFNVKRTSKAEKMATVLASWNDFLIDGVNPTDDMIINDIVTNWTVNKANISVETWREIIHQLKENQMIPKGYGKHTLKKEQNDYAH